MKTPIATLLIVLWVAVLPQVTRAQSSSGNSTVFMAIQGQNGVIQGEVTQAGREGWHRLQAYSHEIVSPRDAASELPTGKRQHKPFSIVKLVNRGSPLLLNAMVKNETLPSVDISIWSPSPTGQEQKVYHYRLVDAAVVSIRPWMPNENDPSTRDYPPAEEIAFTYRRIEVTFINGGITAEDDWESVARSLKTTAKQR